MAIFPVSSLNYDAFTYTMAGIAMCYMLYFSWVSYGWKQIPIQTPTPIPDSLKFSILIAARDEAERLPLLLRDLENQTFPLSNFEVLIVDDHSSSPVKNLPAIVNSKLQTLRIIELPQNRFGKKTALACGAEESQFEYLLFTDADCRIPPNWIASHASSFVENRADMNIGLVDQETNGKLIGIFFRLEFLSLVLSGAGTAGQLRPTLCNGANLSLKRSLYMENSGNLNEQLPSGDDVFLLHALKRIPGCRITVLKTKDAWVRTQGPGSVAAFLKQRLRWGSKSPAYKDRDTIFMSILVFLANISLLACLLTTLLDEGYMTLLLLFFIGKMGIDALLLLSGLKLLGGKNQVLLLPLFELFYPFYLSLTAIASLLMPYRWKQRKY